MENFEMEVRQIMFEKLQEMAEIEFGDCANDEYPVLCSAMNEIARTLLDK